MAGGCGVASVHCRWENGNQVYYDSLTGTRIATMPCQTRMPNPLLLPSTIRMAPDIAMDVVDHFMSFSDDEWTVVLTDVATDGAEVHALIDAHGGIFELGTNDADEDETGIQSDAEICAPDNGADNDTWFMARFQVDDADKAELNIGLQSRDAKIGRHHAAGGGVAEGVYLWSAHDSADLYGSVETGGAATDTAAAIATLDDATWITAGFHFDDSANSVQFNVNGADVGAPLLAGTPAGQELCVAFCIQTGENVIHTLKVDWYRLISEIG